MYRQTVRFYVFLLTLLEISLNCKLTAHGKSHGVIHDAVISDGITFQEWGKDAGSVGADGGAASGALSVSPAALSFGRASLGAAHALTVTVTNTANTTLHLASVAGTTPDFHASFFDSKTLPPQANTSFSVVYVGRSEGPVAAHLYIHTSLGVHKYEVSAVGTASPWGVWPLVGLRVPRDAALTPTLSLTNPTDSTVQVLSVYSSAGWLGLELPPGGTWAPRALWTLPPRTTRPLVRLRVTAHALDHPRQAYIRIKTDAVGAAPLVVCVEARAAPGGVHADPVQIRAGVRGSLDPPSTFEISLGNSASTDVTLEPTVTSARCSRLDAPPPPPPPRTANGDATNGDNTNGDTSNGDSNGAGGEPARVALLTTHLEANSLLKKAASVTLDWAAMWQTARIPAAAASGSGALCSGYVQLGDAALPYSATLLPGTLHVDPLHFVCADRSSCSRERLALARNDFSSPLHVTHLAFEEDLLQHFHVEPFSPRVVSSGATTTLTSLRLRDPESEVTLHSHMRVHTNVTVYTVPVLVYSGRLLFEWQWPESYSGALSLGAVATGAELRVSLRLRNPAPATVCIISLDVDLPHASLTTPDVHDERVCVEPGDAVEALLRLRAPGAEGAVRGAVWVSTQHARAQHAVTLHAVHGDVRARAVSLDHCAPWVVCSSPLLVDSSMAATMRLLRARSDQPALTHVGGANWEVGHGESALGELQYRHELSSHMHADLAHVYTGLDLNTTEGSAWVRRADASVATLLSADAALLRARLALFDRADRHTHTLTLSTTHVVQVPVDVSVRLRWPRLARAGAVVGGAALAPVGGMGTLQLPVHNPSSRPLLLQPLLHEHHPMPALAGGTDSLECATPDCVTSRDAFNVTSWLAAGGATTLWGRATAGVVLLLEPHATVLVEVAFTPTRPAIHHAYLYLRNNLTILEVVPLSGRGAHPSFELAGRKPGSTQPLLFEVSECGAEGVSTVRRSVALRNTGPVPVRVTSLLVSGHACSAHGFALLTCAPLVLAPNETRPLQLAFTADWTLARVQATLTLVTEFGRGEFVMIAAVPARLLPLCGALLPRAPWEGTLRGAGALLALMLAAIGVVLAALDSEAILKRALAAMHRDRQSESRAPLDLRALNTAPPVPLPPPPPAPAAPPRRRRSHKKDRHMHIFDDKKDLFDWKLSEHATCELVEDDASRSSAEETDVQDAAEAKLDDSPTAFEEEAAPDDDMEPQLHADDEDAVSIGTDSTNSDERERECTSTTSQHDVSRQHDPVAEEAKQSATRARRELATPTRRPRPDRHDDAPTTRPGVKINTNKFHCKKEKSMKRKSVTPSMPPPRPEQPLPVACEARHLNTTPNGGSTVRRGATFSEVVARADSLYSNGSNVPVTTSGDVTRPLAPIGSDLRKRSSPDAVTSSQYARTDNSLFYFNGDAAERPWDPPAAPAPHWDTPAPASTHHYTCDNYQEDKNPLSEYPGRLGASLWSGGDAWSGWGGGGGGYGLRPPPGFPRAPPAPPRVQPPARAYDPFHALAAIWASDRPAWAEPAPQDEADEQRH